MIPRLRQNSRTESSTTPPLPCTLPAEEVEHCDAVGDVAANVEREDDGGRVDTAAVALREGDARALDLEAVVLEAETS